MGWRSFCYRSSDAGSAEEVRCALGRGALGRGECPAPKTERDGRIRWRSSALCAERTILAASSCSGRGDLGAPATAGPCCSDRLRRAGRLAEQCPQPLRSRSIYNSGISIYTYPQCCSCSVRRRPTRACHRRNPPSWHHGDDVAVRSRSTLGCRHDWHRWLSIAGVLKGTSAPVAKRFVVETPTPPIFGLGRPSW